MTAWQLVGGSLVLIPVALLRRGGAARRSPPVSALGFAYLTVDRDRARVRRVVRGTAASAPGVVGVVGLLNPVTGVVLGVALAGEAFGCRRRVGLALVLGGIVLGLAAAAQNGGFATGTRQSSRSRARAERDGMGS